MGESAGTALSSIGNLRNIGISPTLQIVWRHVGEAPCICTPEVNMAAEEENIDMEDETPKEKGKKAAKHDSGAADLEKVTDYVEETEISSQNMADVSTWSLNVGIIAQAYHLSKQETWPRD